MTLFKSSFPPNIFFNINVAVNIKINTKTSDGIPYKHFTKGFSTLRFMLIFNKFKSTTLSTSPNDKIRYASKVLYVDLTIDIPIIYDIIIVKIMLIITCIPKYIGRHLMKNTPTDKITLKIIFFSIFTDFLAITLILHNTKNVSGSNLIKNSIKLSSNIILPPL